MTREALCVVNLMCFLEHSWRDVMDNLEGHVFGLMEISQLEKDVHNHYCAYVGRSHSDEWTILI